MIFQPYFFLVLALVFAYLKKRDSFTIIVYTFLITDFFHQLSGGRGFSFLFLSNFTFRDYFGFLSIYFTLHSLVKKSTPLPKSINQIKYLLLFIVFYLCVLILFSVLFNGTSGVQSNREGIYSFFTLTAFVFNYSHKKIDLPNLFLKILRILVLSSIIIYLLRVGSLIEYSSGAYGREGDYSKYRFLINVQVLYLSIFYIFTSVSRQFGVKLKRTDNILMYISAVLILTSTQRMITILFALYLLYEIIFFKRKQIPIIVFSMFSVLVIALSEQFIKMLESAFLILIESDNSNAASKMKDIPASVIALYNDGSLLFGRLYQKEMLERSFQGFHSRSSRGIHNLFITNLFVGGLVWFSLTLTLWYKVFSLLIKNYRKTKSLTQVYYIHAMIVSVIFIFLFNMSSGAAIINSLILSFSILFVIYYISIFKHENKQ